MSTVCPDKTRADLEWDRVLGALADRCESEPGKAAARDLPFAETHADARLRLDETREATALRASGEALPVVALGPVDEALERLRVGGVLAPAELRVLARMLLWARNVRRFLAPRKERCPALFAACSSDPTLDDPAEEIRQSFDPDGTLSDHASPRLRELRGELRAARARMMSRLEDLMQRYSTVLQDHFVTEREGRYVLPVRSDAHERFPGIVHATSGSGGTLFVEPRAVVPMGNRLKMLEADAVREEEAIYAGLTARLFAALPSVLAAAEAMARADVCAAAARLAEELELTFPEIVPAAVLDLREARHLLLALELPHVVSSDIHVEGGHAMVMSGPNAGGKTVALKTAGLVALLLRAGLPVPCGQGSRAGLFDAVLTDVGDDQSLHKSLSTFSAHVKNLVEILEETRPGALVLLDELAGGTNPRQGEALAAGVLDSLCARGGAVIATTHYEGLKALALGDTRFQNASVGFDLATMTPTFRLTLGVPGSSSALAVARRFGLPPTVIERAERFLSKEERSLEEEVRRVHDERMALELARAAAEEEKRKAEVARVRLEAELEQARSREGRAVSREAEQLMASVRRAREDLRAAQARLRAKKLDEGSVREASRMLDRVAAQVAIGGEIGAVVAAPPEERPALPAPPRVGARVHVPRLRADADVVEVLAGGVVRVAAGPIKLVVPAAELRVAEPVARPERKRSGHGHAPAVRDEHPMQTVDTTCDLRGMRVDDALSMLGAFLDRAAHQGRGAIFVVHGHGTGALREAVRRELGASGYVTRQRAGELSEGGDGVTIAWLA